MGVSITCKKTNDTIDMGYGGFMQLRRKVSDLCGEPWASHYRELTDNRNHPDGWYEEFDAKTEELLNKKRVSIKVVDFLLQSDCEGSIKYGACKQILKIVGDYDDEILYGYAGRPDCARFKDFKRLLTQCVEHKCNLVWF